MHEFYEAVDDHIPRRLPHECPPVGVTEPPKLLTLLGDGVDVVICGTDETVEDEYVFPYRLRKEQRAREVRRTPPPEYLEVRTGNHASPRYILSLKRSASSFATIVEEMRVIGTPIPGWV